MSDPKVYILILNYRQWEDAKECLASVLRSEYTHYSVLLVDNHSGNQSLEHLAQWLEDARFENFPGEITYALLQREEVFKAIPVQFPKVVFIQNTVNEGFAGGNNLALRLLQDEEAYVWLLNPDMVIRKDTLTELVRFTDRQSSACIVGAEVRSYKGNQGLLFYGGGRVNFSLATVQVIRRPACIPALDYISGACLFTHAANFKKLGLLPEDYFLYWEETDWCYRAKLRGLRLCVCSAAVCYDKISTVIGKSFMAHYYYARNGLLFVSKFRRKNIPVVLFFMGLRFLKRIVTGQWGRARGMLKGTIDFLKSRE